MLGKKNYQMLILLKFYIRKKITKINFMNATYLKTIINLSHWLETNLASQALIGYGHQSYLTLRLLIGTQCAAIDWFAIDARPKWDSLAVKYTEKSYDS